MASIDVRESKTGTVYRVSWDLPKAYVPVGQKRAKGSLTVYEHSHALLAKRFAEDAHHAVLGETVEQQLAETLRPKVQSGMLLRDWVDIYLKSVEGDIREKTWKTYRTQLSAICDEIGNTPLKELDGITVKTCLQNLKTKNNLKFSTVDRHFAALKACLNVAVNNGKVDRNAAKAAGWKVGRQEENAADEETEPEKFFEPKEYALLVSEFRPDFRLFVEFLGETGVRFSEACALRVRELNFDRNTADIIMTWSDGSLELPKSGKTRWVSVPASLMKRIADHVALKNPDDLVFTSSKGKVINNSNFRRDHWDPAMIRLRQCKRHLPERIDGRNGLSVYDPHSPSKCDCLSHRTWTSFTPHALRHTYATWLIREGVPTSHVARQLGHTTTKTTELIYAHLKKYWFTAEANLALKMDKILGRDSEPASAFRV